MIKTVHPILAVGAVTLHNDKVLLVQRHQAPNPGQWSIPGGKVHLGETLARAAEREILEETGVVIRAGKPIYTFEIIEPDAHGGIVFHYVVIDLLAEYIRGEPVPGDDAREAAWIGREEFAHLPINQTTRALLKTQFHFPG